MTSAEFSAWVDAMRETRGWSARECQRQLGCGFNQVARWKRHDPPHYIGLACAALGHGILVPRTPKKDETNV